MTRGTNSSLAPRGLVHQLAAEACALRDTLTAAGHPDPDTEAQVRVLEGVPDVPYDRFLAAYDPAARVRYGAFETPAAVVDYLVRGADALLRGLGAALADATVLDPCTGSGAFLRGVLDLAPDHPALFGYELLPAPLRLAAARYPAARLTRGSALELGRDFPATAPLVVLGNPPYAGHSANTGAWITALLHADDPPPFFPPNGAEANVKWLLDDYVKFLRLGQWLVARAGAGVLALVTNHGYLENPTFRALRASLAATFDACYLLDLHGNRRRDGDENLFPIRSGVALGIFVKDPTRRAKGVFHAALHGSRAEKLAWLTTHTFADTPWMPATPTCFVPRDATRAAEYARGVPLPALFPVHALGLLTKRDALVVGTSAEEVLERLARFADPARGDAEVAAAFHLPLHDRDRWRLPRARAALAGGVDPALIRPVNYRPLAHHVLYYHDILVARPNHRVLDHLLHPNMALVVGRQGGATGAPAWDVAWVADTLVDQNFFRRGGATVFPLYLYGDGRTPNLDPVHLDAWAARLGFLPAPEAVLAYVYALLQAPAFGARYADFLRNDFPRIPLTADAARFHTLAVLGAELVALHLGRTAPAPADTAGVAAFTVGGHHPAAHGAAPALIAATLALRCRLDAAISDW